MKSCQGGGYSEFKLLIVTEEKNKKFFKETNNYILRTVKYYAPDKDVTGKKYLNNGWDEIFDEFYTKKPKGYKKNKKYKFE